MFHSYVKERLVLFWKKFIVRYKDLVDKYSVSTSLIIHDSLEVLILGTDVVNYLICVLTILLTYVKLLILCVYLILINIITQCWLLCTYFDIFTYYICLFCSNIVFNIIEFYSTVIQVRGLASYKTSFNPIFSTQ